MDLGGKYHPTWKVWVPKCCKYPRKWEVRTPKWCNTVEIAASSSKMLQIAGKTDRTADSHRILPQKNVVFRWPDCDLSQPKSGGPNISLWPKWWGKGFYQTSTGMKKITIFTIVQERSGWLTQMINLAWDFAVALRYFWWKNPAPVVRCFIPWKSIRTTVFHNVPIVSNRISQPSTVWPLDHRWSRDHGTFHQLFDPWVRGAGTAAGSAAAWRWQDQGDLSGVRRVHCHTGCMGKTWARHGRCF